GRPWRAIVKAGVRDERSARALVRRDARWRLANGVLIAGIGQPGYAAEAPELSPEALDVLDRGLSLAAWGRGAESAGLLASHLPLDRLDPRLAAAARRLLRHLAEAGIAFGVDDAGVEAVIHIRTTLGPR
ncbi:MAG TPA: hypothetical protein VKE22_08785, partial [Haliangiales bacterium]|nr:hypothetical protein [Haliangiales bacterium]